MSMRHINRRQVVQGLALAGLARPAWAQQSYAGQTLIAVRTKSNFLGPESPPTEHWHFKTDAGLPIIRAKRGEEVRFRVVNQLDEEFWLHFYGLRAANAVTSFQVTSGGEMEIAVAPPDAGTFWFGPLLNSAKQREMGLTGMLIVDEPEEPIFQDVPLIFDDWNLGDDGKVEADFANLNRAAGEGRLGNWFTVNGKTKPRISLEPERPARLRLLNVANTRSINVQFKGIEALVLARDGQPVSPKPLGLEALHLAPGQRIDLLLTEAQEQVVIALDLFEDVVEAAFLDAPGYGRKTLPREFRLPPNPVSPVDASVAPGEIELVIEGGFKGGLKRARVGTETLDLRAMLEKGLAWSIGGSSGLGSPLIFTAKRGEVLRLFFDNRTAFEQPLHVHGHVWTLNEPLAANLAGPPLPMDWSDTLLVPANAKRSVLIVADNPGTWVIQSLLAERSDAGLIGAFTVSETP